VYSQSQNIKWEVAYLLKDIENTLTHFFAMFVDLALRK